MDSQGKIPFSGDAGTQNYIIIIISVSRRTCLVLLLLLLNFQSSKLCSQHLFTRKMVDLEAVKTQVKRDLAMATAEESTAYIAEIIGMIRSEFTALEMDSEWDCDSLITGIVALGVVRYTHIYDVSCIESVFYVQTLIWSGLHAVSDSEDILEYWLTSQRL